MPATTGPGTMPNPGTQSQPPQPHRGSTLLRQRMASHTARAAALETVAKLGDTLTPNSPEDIALQTVASMIPQA